MKKISFRLDVVCTLCCILIAAPGSAQIVLPEIRDTGTIRDVEGRPVTPASSATHAQYKVHRYQAERESKYTILDSVPHGAVTRDVKAFAEREVPKFMSSAGLQHQPFAVVSTNAARDTLALRHFTAWLTTANLPDADKASAYLAKFQANLDPDIPSRIPVAEASLRALHQLGAKYNGLTFNMERELVAAYYTMGIADSVISHAEQMFDRAFRDARTWSERRGYLYSLPVRELVQAYSGKVDGAQKIRTILTRYRDGYNVTEKDEATLTEMQRKYEVPQFIAEAERIVKQLQMLGQPAPALQAHAWFNVGDSAMHQTPVRKELADGKIRILEFGDQWCGPCKDALPVMERLSKHYRQQPVEMLYITYTRGNWGVDVVSPEKEVEHCRDLYVDRLKVTFPIAVWAGKKVPTDEGGMIPEESPNSVAFKLGGTPLFVIVDGAGRIRYTRGGYDAKHTERELKTVVDFILKADSQEAGTPSLLRPVQTTSSTAILSQ